MKRIYVNALCAALLSAAACTTALAVPALPKPITVTQPDGTRITIQLRGDEHLNWAETTDGFTLLRNADGFWTFAEKNGDGKLMASSMVYSGSSAAARAKGIAPQLRFSAEQVNEAMLRPLSNAFNKKPENKRLKSVSADKSQFMVDGTFPSTGKRKLLVLLVNYSDTKTTYPQKEFQNMMMQENYGGIGSLRDYYLQQSYGKLDLDITVTDWITLPKSKATYGADGAAYMIYDALSQLTQDKTIDLTQFDNDGDGILDGLAVIHQGYGQEASSNATDIWSHSSIIYGQTFNGVNVRRYTIEPEINAKNNKIQQIGVIAHEFGHALGAPDFYDTDYSSNGEFNGTGIWDLLANGAWSGDYGSRPTGINGWQKWVWGWTEPTVLDKSTTVTDMPSAYDEPVAYRMETGTPGEYFFMENRQNTKGFDQSLPGHGLIIYHVDENLIKSKVYTNDINAAYPQGIYTVCSDAGVDPDKSPSSYGQVNSKYAPFPGEMNHTEFSDYTAPSAKARNGRFSYRSLTDITDADGKVGFKFTHLEEPEKPADLTARTSEGTVKMTWTINGEDLVDHFNIYRDNEKIATANGCAFTDANPVDGKIITYQVDAEYKDGRLSHPTETTILVPENKANGLTAESNADNTVNLAWSMGNTLKRADLFSGNTTDIDIYGDVVEYANCYTPADLKNYVGGKITKMAFFPGQQGPSDIAVNFRIWEGDANGKNMKIVSERNVKEFATAQRRELKLTTPVTIQADKTYWISVYNKASKGVVSPVTDLNSILVNGRGNCVMNADGTEFVPYADAQGNFYVEATMTLPDAASGYDYDEAPGMDFNFNTDLFYPLCYVVHRDDTPIAYTTKREKVFSNEPAGTHVYTVSSYYNGGNESTRLSQTVEVMGTTAIEEIGDNGASVSVNGDFVVVNGFKGTVTVSDAAGIHRSYAVDGSSNAIQLAKGLNIIKVGGKVFKMIR